MNTNKTLAILTILIFTISILPLNIFAETDSEISLESESDIEGNLKKREIKSDIKIQAAEKFKNSDAQFKLKSENSAALEQKIIKLKECKNSDDIECKEYKENAVKYAKEYLINLIDRLIAYLNKLTAKYETSEEITENTAQLSTEEIKTLLNQLQELKTKIEKATTRDEIISLSSELKTLINQRIKINSKLYVEKLKLHRIGEIIERIEHLKIKLNSVLEELKERGSNTENSERVNELVTKFNSLIDDAKSNYYKAVDVFEQAKEIRESNPEEAKKLVLESHEKLKIAQQDLQEAHSLLVELYQMIKVKSGDIKTECWQDKPSYEPGRDLGFFIWQNSCEDNTWFLDWSGDLRNKDDLISQNIKNSEEFTIEKMKILRKEKMQLLKENLGIKERMRLKAEFDHDEEVEIESETEIEEESEISGRSIKNVLNRDSSGSDRARSIKKAIDEANYCNTSDDCINIGSACPFGCNIVVNKDKASEIKEKISNYPSTCMYQCVASDPIECVSNKCKATIKNVDTEPTNNERTNYYHITGSVTTNGKFMDIGPRRFDKKDSFKVSENKIVFDAWVGPSMDGLRFRTTGDQVTYDLMIDGKQVKELVFIGKNKKNPSEIPFTLTGKVTTTPNCKTTEVIYENTCQKRVIADDSDVATEVEVTSENEIEMVMQ